jgi:hypothetical protein
MYEYIMILHMNSFPNDGRLSIRPEITNYNIFFSKGFWWCNAEAYTTASQAVFFVGAIVGGFLIGWIADRSINVYLHMFN